LEMVELDGMRLTYLCVFAKKTLQLKSSAL
jgi:hypothetical protein